jgi:Spy/CpxP family protein refolding chaperone
MQLNRFKTLAVVLAIALCATVAFSQSVVKTSHGMGRFGGRGFGPQMFGFNADYLDLSDAQMTQMKNILTKEKPTVQPLMRQLMQGHQQMQQLGQAGGFDEAKVRAVASQQSQAMTELIVQKERIKSELMTVLTQDQKDRLAKVQDRRQARLQKHLQGAQGAPATQ